jgi:hypothetical protein
VTRQGRLRCQVVTNDQGEPVGTGRAAGPLTDVDRAAVAEFAAYLRARWAEDHPDRGEPDGEGATRRTEQGV